jgi:hypothetical protein
MKALIKFDLDDPDDIIKYKRYNKADDMTFMLFELLRNTKKGLLYSVENKEMDKYKAIEFVFEKIYELGNEYNINIDEILV